MATNSGADDGEERPRLFVAACLSDAVCGQLEALQRRLAMPGDPFRWARAEGLHLTLKFLGETPAAQIERTEQSLARAVERSGPLTLWLRRLGCFPSPLRPRVLWIGLEGDVEPLQRLQQRVDKRLSEVGFARETRRFQPHITLARGRAPLSAEQAAALRGRLESEIPDYGPEAIDSIRLMRSVLRPGGATYTTVATFALGRDAREAVRATAR